MSTLFVIGDSISLDYGPYLEAALPVEIRYSRKEGEREAYRDLDRPRGGNGGDSGMVLEYLQHLKQRETFQADLLLLNCGLHDIKSDLKTGALQVSRDDYRSNLEAITTVAMEMAGTVAWMRTTPVDDAQHALRGCGFARVQADVDRYNRIADEVMRSRNIPVIPLDEITRALEEEMTLYRDGVHFLRDVQQLQGQYLADWVSRQLMR